MANRTDDDTTTAAGRLGALLTHLRQRPVTGPEGHSYIASGAHTAPVHSPALVDLDAVDHINASLREVIDYAHQAAPDGEPPSERSQSVYQWVVDRTQDADEDVKRRRDTIIYRQSLEHAIAAGDIKAVRPHRCPACRTLGLMWRGGAAVCTNGKCLTREGLSHRWTLARLAYEHVAALYENSVRDCAT